LPLGVLACVTVWTLERAVHNLNPVDRVGLPALASVLFVLALLFWRRLGNFRFLEGVYFSSFGLYMLASLGHTLLCGRMTPAVQADISGLAIWFPTLYLLAFLIFGARGWRLASLFYALTVVVGLIHFAPLMLSGDVHNSLLLLSQVYLANGLVILLCAAFARLNALHTRHALEMAKLAHTDDLTRVHNRRQLERILSEERKRALRYGSRFSVVMLDLDHFKQVNDLHGHDVGDAILRELARLVQREVRRLDHVGRWGGEEFLLILPELTLGEAHLTAQRIRSAIEAHTFEKVGRLTASLGVAEFAQDTVQGLVKRVDTALYKAKAEGRNRVAEAFEPPRAEVARGIAQL